MAKDLFLGVVGAAAFQAAIGGSIRRIDQLGKEISDLQASAKRIQAVRVRYDDRPMGIRRARFFPTISPSGATFSRIRRSGMILPTKHIRPDRCLIGVGGEVIGALERPMTMSKLWDAIRRRRSADTGSPVVDYRWFVLALDLLYTIRAIEFERGVIRRARP